MKKIVALGLLLSIFITSVSDFSFAQDLSPSELADIEAAYCTTQSSVCGTAPEPFTFLMDFVREMMNSIKTIGPEGDYLGQYVNPNRFQGTEFIAPKKTILGKVARNVAQKAKFVLATTAIFSSPVNVAGLKDMLGSTILLSKNQVFLRDNKLIEQLDTQLNDKKYELGIGGGWYAQIIPQNIAIMQSIIQKYIDKGLLVPSSKINAGVSYNNVTSLLTQVLSSAKSFLYFGTTEQFDSMTRGSSDQTIFVGFMNDAMTTVKRDYECARGPNYICSSESKTIKEKLSQMWKSLHLGSSSTKKTFKDAVTRLGEIFSKTQSQSFKDREADLLKSMYGTQKRTPGKLIDVNYEETNGSAATVVDIGKGIGDVASTIGQLAITGWTMLNAIAHNIEEEKQIQDDIVVPSHVYDVPDNFSMVIDSYINDVILSQQTDFKLISVAEVRSVTPAFAVLGQQLSVIKNDILGGKDNKNSLRGSLGGACELQCGRGGLCR